ncbi:MAG TPA: LLM class flavin-dependent oxidoreductase, partial [Actinomycetota bacterium]|nr:LLM class flavin-dependent oxidoreductase [Actinomycetota bacterium]
LVPPAATTAGPPVWLGAQADEVVRMAARVADGWNGWGMDVEAFRAKATLLDREARAAGRTAAATWAGIVLVGSDDAEAEMLLERRHAKGMTDGVWSGGVERFIGFLDGLAAAGADWAVFVVAGPADRRDLLTDEVLPRLGSRIAAD